MFTVVNPWRAYPLGDVLFVSRHVVEMTDDECVTAAYTAPLDRRTHEIVARGVDSGLLHDVREVAIGRGIVIAVRRDSYSSATIHTVQLISESDDEYLAAAQESLRDSIVSPLCSPSMNLSKERVHE